MVEVEVLWGLGLGRLMPLGAMTKGCVGSALAGYLSLQYTFAYPRGPRVGGSGVFFSIASLLYLLLLFNQTSTSKYFNLFLSSFPPSGKYWCTTLPEARWGSRQNGSIEVEQSYPNMGIIRYCLSKEHNGENANRNEEQNKETD